MLRNVDAAGGGVAPRSGRLAGLATCLALTLFLGGCRLIGGGGPDRDSRPTPETDLPVPEGQFQGFIEVEGGRVEGNLALRPGAGATLEGTFEAPPDLTASGPGGVYGDQLELDLRYEGECPGHMTLTGTWEPGPGRITGVVEARDCTGRARGTFLFQRYRPGAWPGN